MMRKSDILCVVAATGLMVAPAHAVGLGDLAKVILSNGSILTKGQQKCGAAAALTPKEQIELSLARALVKKSLPLQEYLALDQASETAANTASQSATFCPEAPKKKKGLLAKIARAAKGLAGAKAII